MTTNFTRKLTIASLALAGVTASFAAFSAPSSAHADEKPAAGVYSKSLTFTYQTTNPNPNPVQVDDFAGPQQSAEGKAKHGVDYTWSVQSGQDSVIREVSGLKMEQGVIEAGDAINDGVGELQECTISKSMDTASTKLAQFAINGNSPSASEYGKDGAKGGNVEFEWKVEEGES